VGKGGRETEEGGGVGRDEREREGGGRGWGGGNGDRRGRKAAERERKSRWVGVAGEWRGWKGVVKGDSIRGRGRTGKR